MSLEIKVPSPGESISEVQLANWLVADGDYVEKDEDVAEIDSDKATLTISAEEAGTISLKAEEGDTLEVGAVIALIDTDAKAPAKSKSEPQKEKEKEEEKEETPDSANKAEEKKDKKEESAKAQEKATEKEVEETEIHISPLAKKLLEEKGMSESQFVDLLRKYRVSKKDVEYFLGNRTAESTEAPVAWGGGRDTESKKMTMLRQKVAERLVAVKNETAMLTTFNEVNMTPIMDIRNRYKEAFKEKFGVSLGFMSFFTKAITEAIRHFPAVNAKIDGDEIIYHNYADIGIAVSTPKGLMVPVIRNAETLSLAEIESQIKELATKARNNKISIEEMQGGTFTITNGGVFGSMLSTPIINPPQSAILGMHNIVERPVAVNGEVQIHPIMYVALSYDHRIIDGRESVSFLVKVKEMLENPVWMLHQGNNPVSKLLGL